MGTTFCSARFFCLLLAFVAVGCGGPDRLVIEDGSAVPELRSSALARCGASSPLETGSLGEDDSSFPGLEIFLDRSEYSPGVTAVFDWVVPDEINITTGNDWIVQCWDGDQWANAWAVTNVYGSVNRPNPVLTSVDGVLVFDDDGWDTDPGSIPIPADAPQGSYRLNETYTIFLGDDSQDRQRVTVRAFFEVTEN